MRGAATLTLFVVASAVAAFAYLGTDLVVSRPEPGVGGADSVWYHASDVALLGQTGRPQLVEFFHPD